MRRLAAPLLVLLLAGCSGGSSGGSQDKALKTAVQAYSAAYLSGDGAAAWGLLSERCQDRLSRQQFLAGVEQAGQIYGSTPITSLRVDSLAGDLARVSYTFEESSIDQDREPWVREDGAWHEDDC